MSEQPPGLPARGVDRGRETAEVWSFDELVTALSDDAAVVHGAQAIHDLIAARVDHERS